MKVLEARKMRLSEGLCPACETRLLRIQEQGVCTCCRYCWRLRDSEIEVRIPDDGEWLPDSEGPQSCGGAGWHSYHLESQLFWEGQGHTRIIVEESPPPQ